MGDYPWQKGRESGKKFVSLDRFSKQIFRYRFMKLVEYKFDLPTHLIASEPVSRGEARMMVVDRKTNTITHKKVKDIIDYFSEGDAFVFNDTKVFPARMYGNKEKTGAMIEVFLLRELNKKMRLWDVLVDPARKIRVGNKLYFGEENELVAEVIDNTTSRGRTIRFIFDGTDEELREVLYSMGETPVPSIIGRGTNENDEVDYQTVYAKHVGAVAAPAAGLHFDKPLLKRLELVGIDVANVTLHAGLGGLRMVEVEDLTKHKPESENFEVTPEACDIVNRALEEKKRILAVGGTVLRSLESTVSANNRLKPVQGWTDKYIIPPYNFQIADAFFTGFHLPQTTLLMMATAFGGYDLIMEAYKTAIKEEYRFCVYGDAMLIL